MLPIEYHVYIWGVSPQLSCGDTHQIWKWFKESNRCFFKIKNFHNGEVIGQSLVTPTPGPQAPGYKAHFTDMFSIEIHWKNILLKPELKHEIFLSN